MLKILTRAIIEMSPACSFFFLLLYSVYFVEGLIITLKSVGSRKSLVKGGQINSFCLF